MTYDFTNKSDREKAHELVKEIIESHKNNLKLELTVNALKAVEQLIETQERIIEDQEERIAIMTEGQMQAHWVLTGRKNVYGGIEVACSHCNSTVMVSNVSDEKYCRTCGAMMDVPPKEGEAE